MEDIFGKNNPARWQHDCDACVYLGHFSKYDLYFCNSRNPTVIARFGMYGDYYSGLVFAATNPALAVAVSRAYDLGLWYTPAPTPLQILDARKRVEVTWNEQFKVNKR